MAPDLSPEGNELEINLPVPRQEMTFGSRYPQWIDCHTLLGCDRILDNHDISAVAALSRDLFRTARRISDYDYRQYNSKHARQAAIPSIQELSKLICIPTNTVHRNLTSSLGFVVKHVCWVPHKQKETQKGQRVSLCDQLLRELRWIKHHS
jgi:hypothetical protein